MIFKSQVSILLSLDKLKMKKKTNMQLMMTKTF